MAATVTGKNATVAIGVSTLKDQNTWAISDFSITFDRGTVEQELVGQPGNYFDQGALSVEGSLTQCRFAASGNADALMNLIDGTGANEYIRISGSVGSTGGISWYFVSCQITSYEVTMGDADTITEASIDWQLIDPQHVSYSAGNITDVS